MIVSTKLKILSNFSQDNSPPVTGRGLARMARPPESANSKCPVVDPSLVDVFAAWVAAWRYWEKSLIQQAVIQWIPEFNIFFQRNYWRRSVLNLLFNILYEWPLLVCLLVSKHWFKWNARYSNPFSSAFWTPIKSARILLSSKVHLTHIVQGPRCSVDQDMVNISTQESCEQNDAECGLQAAVGLQYSKCERKSYLYRLSRISLDLYTIVLFSTPNILLALEYAWEFSFSFR